MGKEVSMLSEKLQTYNSTDDLGDILDKASPETNLIFMIN